jgi:hypothetical protein
MRPFARACRRSLVRQLVHERRGAQQRRIALLCGHVRCARALIRHSVTATNTMWMMLVYMKKKSVPKTCSTCAATTGPAMAPIEKKKLKPAARMTYCPGLAWSLACAADNEYSGRANAPNRKMPARAAQFRLRCHTATAACPKPPLQAWRRSAPSAGPAGPTAIPTAAAGRPRPRCQPT